jgi:hypothetical protein
MRTLTSLICGFVAFLALVLIAEWVPDLLPRSPNLAYSTSPYVSSPWFPATLAFLSAVGFAASVLVWGRHRCAIVAFTAFWITLVSGSVYFIHIDRTRMPNKIIALALLIYFGIMFWRDLYRNSRLDIEKF